MKMWSRFITVFCCFFLTVASIAGTGCQTTTRRSPGDSPRPLELRITQSVGGTHYRSIVIGDSALDDDRFWYQTFGSDLLVLHPRSGRQLSRLELGPAGHTAPAVDIALYRRRLFIALEDEAVVEVDISQPDRPRVTGRINAGEIGVSPRVLSVADGQLFVSGPGGVMRWGDQSRVFSSDDPPGRVAKSEDGLAVCVGRRIYRLDDGRYAGSASDLYESRLEDTPLGTLVFVRQIADGAQVGLMTPGLREVDARTASVTVPGIVRHVRTTANRIWVITDDEIIGYRVYQNRLVRMQSIDLLGARDLAAIDDDHLAIAGSFGRTIYRLRSTDRGQGDTFTHTHREPSRLTVAKSDGRHILAGSREGAWLYRIGSSVELVESAIDAADEATRPKRHATTTDVEARISDDGGALLLETQHGTLMHREPDESTIHCVVAIDGRFWIGHDRGITVIEINPGRARRDEPSDGRVSVFGRLRLDGPVRYLYPLRLDQGVAYVSEWGGFGTASL